MTFGQKYNLDKVKRKMIFEKTVFYDILYLTYIIHSCAVNNIGLINLQETNEVDITEHPEILQYAFGMNKLNAQTLLKWQYQTQDKDLKPDFMPERMDGYCDIMEFKMPNLDGKCIVGTNERICLIML